MYIAVGIIILVILYIIYEYRVKKPGQIVLYESNGEVKYRTSRFYPRHFSLTISNTTYTLASVVEPEAKGMIGLVVKYSAAVTPSPEHIGKLIRIGGWGKDVLSDAARELDIILQGFVKEYTGKYDIENLKPEGIAEYLRGKTTEINKQLGLEILSLTIQSVEPSDKRIAEAIRQKEASRILEETERNSQHIRIQTAQMKLKADEEILRFEHDLEMKRLQIRETVEDKEASLSMKKLNEQIKRDKMRLQIEKDEVSMFKDNPELLLLTPQVAKLAEASQNLKNARTVVSLGDIENGSQIADLIKNFLGGLLKTTAKK